MIAFMNVLRIFPWWPILWPSPSEISNQHKKWKCVEDYLCTFMVRFSLIHLSCKTFYLYSPRVYVKLDPVGHPSWMKNKAKIIWTIILSKFPFTWLIPFKNSDVNLCTAMATIFSFNNKFNFVQLALKKHSR